MKKTLPTLIYLFLAFIPIHVFGQQTGCPDCRMRPKCRLEKYPIIVEYFGAASQPDGNTQLRFNIVNQTPFPVEYLTFELPGSQTAAAAPVASFISYYHYAVQNLYADSLIKFTGLNTATFRYDQGDIFWYKVATSLFNAPGNEYIEIKVKTGDLITTVNFNVNNCTQKNTPELPAAIALFKSQSAAEGVTLTWEATSKAPGNLFMVQHAAAGQAFKPLGQVAATPTSAGQLHYQFTHAAPPAGINYYRLQQTNSAGSATFSPAIVVEVPKTEASAGLGFTVFPNPVTNRRFSFLPAAGKAFSNQLPANLILRDLKGKTLWELPLKPGFETEMRLPEKLPPGVYLLTLQAAGQIATQKIIVH